MEKRVHIYVSGIVQGVFFRHNTAAKARALGLRGWVRNLDDGRVEIVCEGPKQEMEDMVEWCGEGPAGAFVKNMDVAWEEYANEFNSFEIIY